MHHLLCSVKGSNKRRLTSPNRQSDGWIKLGHLSLRYQTVEAECVVWMEGMETTQFQVWGGSWSRQYLMPKLKKKSTSDFSIPVRLGSGTLNSPLNKILLEGHVSHHLNGNNIKWFFYWKLGTIDLHWLYKLYVRHWAMFQYLFSIRRWVFWNIAWCILRKVTISIPIHLKTWMLPSIQSIAL